MKITSIAVDGVGRFGGRAEIRGLGSGVNVLAAENEAGKSTFFRALRTCLFERHGTKAASVQELATAGLSLPVTVAVGFEHGGAAYEIRKSFLRAPSASLRRDGAEIARGREADEEVWTLLGINPGARAGGDPAFGMLWVDQGASFTRPVLTDAEKSALAAAVEAEVGTLLGGERARAVLAKVTRELAELVTEKAGTAKVGGPLASARRQLDAATLAQAEAERKLALLDDQFGQLAHRRAELARLSDPAEQDRLAAGLESARRTQRDAERSRAELELVEAREREARAVREQADTRLAQLEASARAIDDDRRREGATLADQSSLNEELRTTRAAIDATRRARETLDAKARTLRTEERHLQRMAQAATRVADRPGLVERLARLETIGGRLVETQAALNVNRVTAEAVTALDQIERDLAIAEARLKAAAPQVAIALHRPDGSVAVDGERITADQVRAVVTPLTVQVGELATITVSPPATGDHRTMADLLARQAGLVGEAGFASAEEMREAHRRRLALEAARVALRAELDGLGAANASPSALADQMRTRIGEIDALVAQILAETGRDALPATGEIESRRDAVERELATIGRDLRELESASETQAAANARMAGALGETNGALAAIRNALAANLATLPDAERERRLAEARTASASARDAHGEQAAILGERRRSVPSADELAGLRERIARFESALRNRDDQLAALRDQVSRLGGQIENAGGDGLGETVEALREESDLVRREVERWEARAAALQLLKQTIEACDREQRDRLNAPLLRHLGPLLRDVFPSAEPEIGDDFTVLGLRRDGPAEAFGSLSAGTQEQIAILVRLAMGALLAERGQEVPIILDDALVFSDDGRIEQMFDALNRAGRSQQVIVLTCRTRAFAALGGRTLSIAAAPG